MSRSVTEGAKEKRVLLPLWRRSGSFGAVSSGTQIWVIWVWYGLAAGLASDAAWQATGTVLMGMLACCLAAGAGPGRSSRRGSARR